LILQIDQGFEIKLYSQQGSANVEILQLDVTLPVNQTFSLKELQERNREARLNKRKIGEEGHT
jgi:hypothetical protein